MMTETMEVTMTTSQGTMGSGLEQLLSGGMLVFILAIALLMVVSNWKLLKKANLPGWGVLIPFYNVYLFFKLAGHPNWTWWLLFPPVLAVLAIVANFDIARKFGK